MDESTDFLLLGSATTPPPVPTALWYLTDKIMIYGRIYGFVLIRLATTPPPHHHHPDHTALWYSTDKKINLWTNLRIFSYSVRQLPPPPLLPTSDSRYFARAECELFRLLPEISGFFGIPIGQPCCDQFSGLHVCHQRTRNIVLMKIIHVLAPRSTHGDVLVPRTYLLQL